MPLVIGQVGWATEGRVVLLFEQPLHYISDQDLQGPDVTETAVVRPHSFAFHFRLINIHPTAYESKRVLFGWSSGEE
jgi:hypothetical protein